MNFNLISKDKNGNTKVSFWGCSFLVFLLGLLFGFGFFVSHKLILYLSYCIDTLFL